MTFPLVKICGIRTAEHAVVAAEAGADLIGLVFVPVRRQVTVQTASEIVQAVRRGRADPPAVVGLFVDESAEHINTIVDAAGLDLVQLSGNEPASLASQINVPSLKALRIAAGAPVDDIRELATTFAPAVAGFVVDSHVPGQWGGTGVVGDWHVSAALARAFPISLAGGLNPDNVQTAIDEVRPAIVDVSSGVETDGVKDSEKIIAFIQAARAAKTPLPEGSPAHGLRRTIQQARAQRGVSAVSSDRIGRD